MPTNRQENDTADTISTAAFAPAVGLHKEDADDEPLELDVDVSVTCDCSATATKRDQVYKEQDEASRLFRLRRGVLRCR